MVWTIPNTFVAGTKARANEVNENFTSLKQFIDTLEVQASTNEINITNIENNKANINGSNQQRFQVANPTASFDAVNLQTLKDKTLNSRSVIDGFELSKFDNHTITASAGNCYDSSYVYMISSSTSLQESVESPGENATYYVFVCADEQSNENQIVASLSPTTPEVPTGYDYYRRIGKFTTDGDGYIDSVISENSSPISSDEQLEPNGYVKLTNGLIIQWGSLTVDQTGRDVTLPTPFTKFFFTVQVTSSLVQGAGTDRQRGLIGAAPSGLTGFHIYSGAGVTSSTWTAYWLAIGV